MSYLLCRCTEYVSHASLLSLVIYTCPVHPILHDLILLIFVGKDDHALHILVLPTLVPSLAPDIYFSTLLPKTLPQETTSTTPQLKVITNFRVIIRLVDSID